MVQAKPATESRSIVTRLAKQAIKSVNEPKQGLDHLTKKDPVAQQEKTYAAIVRGNIQGRDQNDHQGTQIGGAQRYIYQNYTELCVFSSQNYDIHCSNFIQTYLQQ
jgi:hypothetical protein